MKIIPRKRFGQHFLQDDSVVQKIVHAINPGADDLVIEIGAGTGRLSDHLIEHAGNLVLIELDRDLAAYLNTRYEKNNGKNTVSIIQDDVLNIDFTTIIQNYPDCRCKVVGNLPYNISTPLLFHLIEFTKHIDEMIFMVQKEVAQRLCALAGDKNYGRLSVMAGLQLDCMQLFDVAASAFNPPPKVESSVIRLQPGKARQKVEDKQLFSRLVRDAFSQRRKTLRNALRDLVAEHEFKAANIDCGLRAENLSISDYINLCNAVSINRTD